MHVSDIEVLLTDGYQESMENLATTADTARIFAIVHVTSLSRIYL